MASGPGERTPFYRLLATKYKAELEGDALSILERHHDLALTEWSGPDDKGHPFVRGSTALHYAANDGKLELMSRLLDLGADPNASNANWFRSVLSWAANNARLEAVTLLLERGASAHSLDAMHAAAWGGSSAGQDLARDYVGTLGLLLSAGADKNDRRHHRDRTPLDVALKSGNEVAVAFLRSLGAEGASDGRKP